MAVYFFDSSGIVKRYVNETGTAWVMGLANPVSGNSLYVARITGVEVISALTRRARTGSLSTAEVTKSVAEFRHDFTNQYQMVEISSDLIARAMSLAETHAIRGYDAVQLAAALRTNAECVAQGMPSLTLISSDTDLNAAATAEGLAVDDPNAHL